MKSKWHIITDLDVWRKLVSTLLFEVLKDAVILDKASNMAGEPAPWAEFDPTSSWSNRATILTPDSWSRECSAKVESIRAWNSIRPKYCVVNLLQIWKRLAIYY
jgi:hypothetical protein